MPFNQNKKYRPYKFKDYFKRRREHRKRMQDQRIEEEDYDAYADEMDEEEEE